MEKKIVSITNIEDCKQFISKTDDSKTVLNITIKDDNYECLQFLGEHSKKIKERLDSINLQLPYEVLPKKDFEVLYNFSVQFPNKKCNVSINYGFIDDEYFVDKKGVVAWDIQTIIKANQSIHDVCDYIKQNKFSPFEAYAYVHKYVSTIAQYNASSNNGNWLAHDQFLSGVFLDLPEVVCMSYSALEKEIIDNLNMPGLKCDVIAISFYNKDRAKTDSHARCMVKVKDDKYGINQSCFEDATWDNIEPNSDKTPMYAHFAMNNDCHETRTNDKYKYYYPSLIKLSPKNIREIIDYNPTWEYNKSENPISQLQIEKAYFNVLAKTNPNANFEKLYSYLMQMAKNSYEEQLSRRFKGNLIQEQPMLTKQMAQTIFKENQQDSIDSYSL